ncbi:hypothetical protein BH10PLA1_BH10PLA1_07040 [soil metagenome]
MRKHKKAILWGLLAVVLLTGFAATIFFGTSTTEEICTICGQTRTVRKFEIPRTHFTIFTFTTTRATRVGKVIELAKLVDVHPHNWKNIYTVGNGTPFTSGDGHDTARVFSSDKVANYLQSISGFESKEAISKYIASLQDVTRMNQDEEGTPASFVNESLLDTGKKRDNLTDLLHEKDATPTPNKP